MRIVWINESASFIGGCEAYIYNTAINLKAMGVASTLIYNPLYPVDGNFLNGFVEAFPLLDLRNQLAEIPHDIIYLHQLNDQHQLGILTDAKAPVIKFFHDHQLFCLRGDKLPYFSNKLCKIPAGCHCYPFGVMPCKQNNFIGIGLKSLWQLKKSQQIHRQFDGYIVASKFMSSQSCHNGFAEEKICTIAPYPFHSENRDSKLIRNPRQILFVGQLIRSKGLDSLLEAMVLLPESYKLFIAGSGRQESVYRKLSSSLGLGQRVSFLGTLQQNDLVNFYRTCSCVVVPSRWPEPFGLVGIEAMQFGAPVVACDVGGIPEWLEEGKNGFLVPPNSPQELMQAVLKICENPELAASMQRYAIKFVKDKFSRQKHFQELQTFFAQKIQAKNYCWGRFTPFGSDTLEQIITSMVNEIKLLLTDNLLPDDYRAIVVVGSYGKGEGGVEMRNGKEYPHNNFDLLMVSRAGIDLTCQKAGLDRLLLPISEKFGIGFDTSVIPECKIKSSLPTLLWYELYHGHKFLLGDSNFIPRLPFGSFKRVPLEEFQALMVNRGTLLIINECLLVSGPQLPDQQKKVVIKHLMKAIIGFGDAALYFLNDNSDNEYHWSYRERQKRVETISALSPSFRQLYAAASAFRFRPDYETYLLQDLSKLTEEVRQQLALVYLECERRGLGQGSLQVNNYVESALQACWLKKPTSFRHYFKGWQGLIHPTSKLLGRSLAAKAAFLRLSPRQRLAVLFPIVAFGWGDQYLKEQAGRYLNANSPMPSDLAKAYLKQWGCYGDINFKRSQSEWRATKA